MNWHGKALGTKADEAIAAIEAQMVDKNVSGEKLNSQVVVDDVKPVDPSAIVVSEKPTYAADAKVIFGLIDLIHIMSLVPIASFTNYY